MDLPKKKACVYVDGFNLYFRALQGTKLKWLNLEALCKLLLSDLDIIKIYFFTAPILRNPHDPNQIIRQEMYWRALGTTPIVEIIKGKFKLQEVPYRLKRPIIQVVPAGTLLDVVLKDGDPPFKANLADDLSVTIRIGTEILADRVEEKHTDVNLGTSAVYDGCANVYDCAVLLTNDSDQLSTVKTIKKLGKTVIILNPDPPYPALELRDAADEMRRIRSNALAQCQFPDELSDSAGRQFHVPADWR